MVKVVGSSQSRNIAYQIFILRIYVLWLIEYIIYTVSVIGFFWFWYIYFIIDSVTEVQRRKIVNILSE
ncbi:hypothetical protein CK911_01190 [Aeromonas sp. CU5]|nr:hypothetical protein CK911_01190 [Aeromonas sp. CU5]